MFVVLSLNTSIYVLHFYMQSVQIILFLLPAHFVLGLGLARAFIGLWNIQGHLLKLDKLLNPLFKSLKCIL